MIVPGSATPTAAGRSTHDPLALRHEAARFEAILLRQVIGTMRKAHLADGLLSSSATDNFREMADANLAESMAKTGTLGIAALIERQLSMPAPDGSSGTRS